MVDLTIMLNKKVDGVIRNDTEQRVIEHIERVFDKGVQVRVSDVLTNKPAELLFTDMSPVDIDDIEVIVEAVIDGLIFSINSLDGKKIGVTIHPTIIYEIEGDVI